MELNTKLGLISFGTIVLIMFAGCSTTQNTTQSPRTAIEQLLHSEAISRSLIRQNEDGLPIPEGAKVAVTTVGLSADNAFVGDVVGVWLGKQGYLLESQENAQYRIHVIVNSLGTEFDETFFGVPPVSGTLLPISVPEIAFYKSQNQTGYTNFDLNVFELPSGRFVYSSLPYIAETFYNDYIVLLMFGFNKTNLDQPPKSESLRRLVE